MYKASIGIKCLNLKEWAWGDSKLWAQMNEAWLIETFGKNICNHLVTWTMFNHDRAFAYFISNVMVMHSNMFWLVVLDIVFCKTDSTLIITSQGCTRKRRVANICQYLAKPNKFTSYKSDAATYSDSVVETATQRCFLLVQETRQPLMKKQLPLVDRIDKCELAQSASV